MKWPIFNKQPLLPKLNSPASFAHKRSYYYHPGIDLYCEQGQEIIAIESGIVVNVEIFTGEKAVPMSPWWNETYSIMIQGELGSIGYCELKPMSYIQPGFSIKEGDLLGSIIPVLKHDKGNGTTMLHFELYKSGTKNHVTWHHGENKPENLLDPTDLLTKIKNLSIM